MEAQAEKVEMIEIKTLVPKESYELAVGLEAFIGDCIQAAKDGVDISDIPTVLASAMQNLYPAVQGVEKIPEEFKADKAAVFEAVFKMSRGVYEKVIS